jgi:hypothetical protein
MQSFGDVRDAILANDVEAIRTNGIAASLVSKYGFDMLRYAARDGLVEMTRYLLKAGCIPSAGAKADSFSAQCSMGSVMDSAVKSGNLELVELLGEHGADINDIQAKTVVTLIEEGNLEMCRVLRARGFQFGSATGCAALESAALRGDVAMLDFLMVEAGVQLPNHQTVLKVCQMAHQQGRAKAFARLLQAYNLDGLLHLLQMSVSEGNLYMAKHLTAHIVAAGYKVPGWSWAAIKSRVLVVGRTDIGEAIAGQLDEANRKQWEVCDESAEIGALLF